MCFFWTEERICNDHDCTILRFPFPVLLSLDVNEMLNPRTYIYKRTRLFTKNIRQRCLHIHRWYPPMLNIFLDEPEQRTNIKNYKFARPVRAPFNEIRFTTSPLEFFTWKPPLSRLMKRVTIWKSISITFSDFSPIFLPLLEIYPIDIFYSFLFFRSRIAKLEETISFFFSKGKLFLRGKGRGLSIHNEHRFEKFFFFFFFEFSRGKAREFPSCGKSLGENNSAVALSSSSF